MKTILALLATIGGLIAAIFGLRAGTQNLKRERDDALEHIDTRKRTEEAARNAPTDADHARDALDKRLRRHQRP